MQPPIVPTQMKILTSEKSDNGNQKAASEWGLNESDDSSISDSASLLLLSSSEIWHQNGQNQYPISDQNGSKTIPFKASHTYRAHIREYPWVICLLK